MFCAACFFAVEYLKQLNPLTPVPPVTAMRKPTPNFPYRRNRPKKSTWGQLPFLPSLKTFWLSFCSIVL